MNIASNIFAEMTMMIMMIQVEMMMALGQMHRELSGMYSGAFSVDVSNMLAL